jgi:hypothetical protein
VGIMVEGEGKPLRANRWQLAGKKSYMMFVLE